MPAQQGSGMDQPSGRRAATVFDQHKRPWACYIDKRSGYPVGVIQPKGWRAPWLPPQGEYFHFDQNDPTKFVINYERLLQERVAASDEFDKDRSRAALVRGWDPLDPEKQEALDLIVGRREGLQRPEVVKACIDGNPWVLGLTDVVDERVAKYIPKKRTAIDNIMSRLPDFSGPSLANDIDALMDIQEAVDPDATPRGVVKVKKQKPAA
jgi:hypothetical protein